MSLSMKFSSESIAKIRQDADIVKVVGHYVSLTKKGTNYIAMCPFHPESYPSLLVNPEHQIYKCFGCGQSGDSVKFMMDAYGIDYEVALRRLVRKFKINVIEE
jgi:DNA primase